MERVMLLLGIMVMGLAMAAPVISAVSSDEVLGAVEKVFPDIIKEPVGLPDAMRAHGSIGDLTENIIKQSSDDTDYPRSKK